MKGYRRNPEDYDPRDFLEPHYYLDTPPPSPESTMSERKKKYSARKEKKKMRDITSEHLVDGLDNLHINCKGRLDIGWLTEVDSDMNISVDNVGKIGEEWEVDETGSYNHINKVYVERVQGVEFKEGEREMDCLIFNMEIKEVVPDITASKSFLFKNPENDKVCLATVIPCDHSRMEKDKLKIQQMSERYFGKSTSRNKGFNRIVRRRNEDGKYSFWRVEVFQLPELERGHQYSTFQFNDNMEFKNQLDACITVEKGGKLLVWAFIFVIFEFFSIFF